MEPQFTRAISSRFVCDYLYFYFILVTLVASVSFIGSVSAVFLVKGSILTKLLIAVPYALAGTIGILLSLSLYIICERGLKPGSEGKENEGRSAEGYRSR